MISGKSESGPDATDRKITETSRAIEQTETNFFTPQTLPAKRQRSSAGRTLGSEVDRALGQRLIDHFLLVFGDVITVEV